WPWPRQVFAEFLEMLEEQKPKAVVFDILYSDPDVFNPDSDEYFNDVIGATDNTYFPMLRLVPENDELSQVTPSMLPGMGKIEGVTQQEKGIALVLPHFPSIIASGRIGTNNVYPERDGIVRQYAIVRNHHGWSIPSLPAKLGEALGWQLPTTQDVFLNWRGKFGAFESVRFSDVFEDFLRRERTRAPEEFTDKIVIIGSTAPNLFDTKPTPVAKTHPGVEILATAIDNLKHGDWITRATNPWVFSALALALIWLTALAFLTGVKRNAIDKVFAGSQIGLMAITFASLNLTTLYVDLTIPITGGLIYFSLARVYAYAEVTLMEKYVWLNIEEGIEGWQHTVVAALQAESLTEASEGKIVTALKRRLNEKKPGFTVEAFPRKPAGIGKAYGNTVLIYYVDAQVEQGEWNAEQTGEAIVGLVRDIAQDVCGGNAGTVHLGHCQGAMPFGDENARVHAWQQLVTKAVLNVGDKDAKTE
ncbi:MAG: CHASE2 domain-containing protein, partial [Candidatus Tectomicrobia bacterium]